MKCPKCSAKSTRVVDSRPLDQSNAVKRKRICPKCEFRFFTEESILLELPMVVKKDGRREPFSREKIDHGIQAACQKRPVGRAQIEDIVERLIDRVSRRGEQEVNSDLIGKFIMAELKKLDEVAYVRFASVYMTFREVNEFFESLEESRI